MADPIFYLIPNTLGEHDPHQVLPPGTISVIHGLEIFIVENAKAARAFMKQVNHPVHVSGLQIVELDKHNKDMLSDIKALFQSKKPIGLLSEAGMPCIADPGSDIVGIAMAQGYRVKPLVGPSSILLALVASGLNGQQFTFNGYLPVPSPERKTALKQLENIIKQTGYTQLFIETPYRNDSLFKEILQTVSGDIKLCIAASLLETQEMIATKTINAWKQNPVDIGKQPCMFLLGK